MIEEKIQVELDDVVCIQCPLCNHAFASFIFDGSPKFEIVTCQNQPEICNRPFVLCTVTIENDALNLAVIQEDMSSIKKWLHIQCLKIESIEGPWIVIEK